MQKITLPASARLKKIKKKNYGRGKQPLSSLYYSSQRLEAKNFPKKVCGTW